MTNFGKFYLLCSPFGAAYFGKNGWTEDGEWPTYFTKANATPVGNKGNPISRDLMNRVGYLATIGPYLDRIGYPFGTEPPFDLNSGSNEGSNGYPRGAIVSIWDDTQKRVREYVSLHDNNTNPRPWVESNSENADSDTTVPMEEEGHWKPLFKMEQYNFFPDYSNRIELLNEDVISQKKDFSVEVPRGGWICVTRTIGNWDDLTLEMKGGVESNTSAPTVQISLSNEFLTPLYIQVQEGKTASRFFPFGTRSFNILAGNPDAIKADGVGYGPLNIKVELLAFEE